MCRKALRQWVFSILEPRFRRLHNPTAKILWEYLDAEKSNGKPIRLVRSRVAAKAVKMLFRKLVDATQAQNQLE
ncbi:hypothetical protein NIES4101_33680 [Calothrix sp. NIES-4101]|nr:hypothetical protein NIES4101_33680 [Calothrix sp. NIES-4101]